MHIGDIALTVVLTLGLIVLLPIWPWGWTPDAADWRPFYETVIRDRDSAALGFHIYNAQSAVRLRQKRIRDQPPDSPERLELGRAEGALLLIGRMRKPSCLGQVNSVGIRVGRSLPWHDHP